MLFSTHRAVRFLRAWASAAYGRALELRSGGELRQLFDREFYRSEYPDVTNTGLDSVAHYFLYGAREGRQPHPFFDTEFYLSEYPDVAGSGQNPLLHYIRHGWKEDRKPNPFFAPRGYRERTGLARDRNPLLHYIAELGAGRAPQVVPCADEFLPSTIREPARITDRPVDVIIPLTGGTAHAEACLRSVLASEARTPFEIVLVENGALDPAALANLAAISRSTVLRAPGGSDFAACVQSGAALHPDRDFITLRNDTAVHGDWIDRLAAAAYGSDRNGTATPFTNSAGICGFPDPQGSPFPDDLVRQDTAVRAANAAIRIPIPLAPGFATYIRRDRLEAAGRTDVLATDVFVGRHGDRREAPPGDDPAHTRRVAAIAYAMRKSGRPVILAITHRLGGGVDEYLRRVRAGVGERAEMLILRPACCGMTILENTNPKAPFTVWIDPQKGSEKLVDLIRSFGLTHVHLQHWKGHRVDIRGLMHDLGVPFDFTIHDYYAACARVTMTDDEGRYCGEPEAGCDTCPGEYREANCWIAEGADRVFAPSFDAAGRFARYFPAARLVVARHPEPAPDVEPSDFRLSPGEPLRIAVLGSMVSHKGLSKLKQCASIARQRRLPMQFHLIGEATGERRFPFTQTGRYEGDEVSALLAQFDPHLVWFPGEAPETYSFTLSVCLQRGLPVVAPDIGCFPERLAGRRHTWIAPYRWTAPEWIQFFRNMHGGKSLAAFAAEMRIPAVTANHHFYEEKYLYPEAGGPRMRE